MSVRASLFVLALLTTALPAADNWPQYRGPAGDGHSDATGLPLKFDEGSHVKWKTAIHGLGWSSPVIWGSQVWVTTARENGTELSILKLDSESGKVLQDKILFRVETPQFIHKSNSYASPTPVIEEGRIYATFGSPGTACLDTKTGEVLWQRTDLVCNHFQGAASSPIVWDKLLIMNFDGSDFQFVIALDKTTGKTVWQTKRSVDFAHAIQEKPAEEGGNYRQAYGTPQVIEFDGKSILLSSGAKAHYAYDPRTGQELWRLDDPAHHSAAARPVVGLGMAFIAEGFSLGEIVALKLGGSGALDESQVAWRLKKGAPKKPSLLLDGDLLYMIADGGIASCVEAKTGQVVWSERVEGKFSASPLLADGRIYVCSEGGAVAVLKAGREFQLLALNQLDGSFMASPAVAGKALYLRTKENLYRVEE